MPAPAQGGDKVQVQVAVAIGPGSGKRKCPRCLGYGHFYKSCKVALPPPAIMMAAWEEQLTILTAKGPPKKKVKALLADAGGPATVVAPSQSAARAFGALVEGL